MSPVDITAMAGVVVTVISSVIVPWVLRRRAEHHDVDAIEVASWTGLTMALQRERDALQARVDKIDAEYREKMAALAEDYRRQLAEVNTQLTAARSRISTLENEVTDLYVRLGRQAP